MNARRNVIDYLRANCLLRNLSVAFILVCIKLRKRAVLLVPSPILVPILVFGMRPLTTSGLPFVDGDVSYLIIESAQFGLIWRQAWRVEFNDTVVIPLLRMQAKKDIAI